MASAGRGSIQALAIERLYHSDERRYSDLAIEVREWVPPEKRGKVRGKTILEVGGRWDREERDWAGDAEEVVVWYVQPAQYEAARWFARWLESYIAGERLEDAPGVAAVLAAGGRRGGKSVWGVMAALLMSVAVRGRIAWCISPTQDETAELKDVIDQLARPEWGHYDETHEIYYLWNGSRIELKSGYKPATLKRGRVDFWLMNEGQHFPSRAYTILRAPLADTRGLGYIAANPPDEPRGQWLLDMYEHAKTGTDTVKLFEFDAELNPTIDYSVLESMRREPGVTDEDFRREVKGEFIPIGDIVFYAYSSKFNVVPRPELLGDDGARRFTQEQLGRPFSRIVVADFQKIPHMAATIWAPFWDDRINDWAHLMVDEVVLAEATEDDLIDGIEALGYSTDTTAVIGDASGEWQDAERTKGRGSFDVFRRRRWRHLYVPDRNSKRNPDVIATVRVVNGLMRNAEGQRRIYVSSHCVHSVRALGRWENRNGAPHKRSDFAHIGDTVRYYAWRFYAPRPKRRPWSYERIELPKSKRQRDLE